MKKRGRIFLTVFLIIAFLIGFVVLMTAFEEPAEVSYPTYSTLHTNRYGAQALFRILEEKGYDVEKNYYSPEKFSSQDSLVNLVLLNPSMYSSTEENDSLIRWIERGNHALLVPDYDNAMFRRLGLRQVKHQHDKPYMNGTLQPARATPTPLLAPVDSIKYAEWEDVETPQPDHFFDESPQSSSIGENWEFSYSFHTDSIPLVPLLTYKGDILMARMPLGKGEVTLLSHPWMFTNHGLKDGENLAFVLSIFEMMGGKGRKLRFDEYYHGFQLDPIATPLNEPPVRAMVIGLLLTFGLMVFSLRRRRARAVPVYVEPRRSISEYIESLGRIFRKKHGEWYLYEDIVSRFKMRLQLSLGLTTQGGVYNREQMRSLSTQKWGTSETNALLLLLDDINATSPQHSPDRLVWIAGRIREFSIRNHLDKHGSKDKHR